MLSQEEIKKFKEILKSFKKIRNIHLAIDFNISDTIAGMRSLKVLKFV